LEVDVAHALLIIAKDVIVNKGERRFLWKTPIIL